MPSIFKKHAHVQNPAGRDEYARENAEITTVAAFEELRNGHKLQIAQPLDDKSAPANRKHRRPGDQAGDERCEPGFVAEFRIIHERHGADFRGCQRRDAQVQPDAAARYQKVGWAGDVLFAVQSSGHGEPEIDQNDGPVDDREVQIERLLVISSSADLETTPEYTSRRVAAGSSACGSLRRTSEYLNGRANRPTVAHHQSGIPARRRHVSVQSVVGRRTGIHRQAVLAFVSLHGRA